MEGLTMRTRSSILLVCLAAAMVVAPAVSADAAGRVFANCTAMHQVYKHGVARSGAHDKVRGSSRPVTAFTVSTSIYNANRKSDRDGDGVACEA
jgi:hypothetical protein